MIKCKACPNPARFPEKSLERIIELLRGYTVMPPESISEAAGRIGPLCPKCLRNWETTIPKTWGARTPDDD